MDLNSNPTPLDHPSVQTGKCVSFSPLIHDYHPPPQLFQSVTSPPYDVISSKDARNIVSTNPHSFLAVTKPETTLDEDIHHFDPSVYLAGKHNLEMFIAKKWLIPEENESFYLYQQKNNNHCQTGFIGAASVEDLLNGHILKHELTRPDKENDRVRLISSQKAQCGPVLLCFEPIPSIETWMTSYINSHAPYAEWVPTFQNHLKTTHKLWVINESNVVSQISALFTQVPTFFIADGHHRAAAALRIFQSTTDPDNPVQESKLPNDDVLDVKSTPKNQNDPYLLSVAYPSNQLQIIGYHRIVSLETFQNFDFMNFVKKLDPNYILFSNSNSNSDLSKYLTFGKAILCYKDTLVSLSISLEPDSTTTKQVLLDVDRVTNNILIPEFGISNLRTDSRISFWGGDSLTEFQIHLSTLSHDSLGIFLSPVSLDSLIAISKRGGLMPPKSTFFSPKLESGVVVRRFTS